MELTTILEKYRPQFEEKYSQQLLSSHYRAMSSILRCRTQDSGEMRYHCTPCEQEEVLYHSCGHRSCPRCQNHEATLWLERQLEKRLPVDYYMVTFTIPRELRSQIWSHQTIGYNALFQAASKTLMAFGESPKHLGAKIGFTAILHTHSRALDFHPHIHAIVPAGGIRKLEGKQQWIGKSNKYLFNGKALAQLFRGKLLALLIEQGLSLPPEKDPQWVVHCKPVGRGEEALQYLSRYLYRGVISERNILSEKDGEITFRYTDSKTKTTRTRRLLAEDFLWLIFQHILPKGFRRVRDYGLLHANAKSLIQQVQLIFHIKLKRREQKGLPEVCCKICKQAMRLIAVHIRPSVKIPPVQIITNNGASP
jgi:hypothetical protein